ncbi:MAG: DUF2997 domain-containing protein [Pirellulales bacterium]|nr:DUF2997 domain-containing protein [Pirellulales bacterium]
MKRIEVIVSNTGQTRLVTKGFEGRECRDASRFLELAMGKTVSDHLTSEYFDIRGRAKARAKLKR